MKKLLFSSNFVYQNTTLHVLLVLRIPVEKHQYRLIFEQIVSYNPQKYGFFFYLKASLF